MKLDAVGMAKCTWVFDLAQVNPEGRSLLDVIEALAKRYRFAKFPQHLLDVNSENALEFNSGTFMLGKLDLRIGLSVYNDGMAADSISSTENSDAFMEDVSNWLAKEHDLHLKPHLKRKIYLSHMDVTAHAELPLLNPKLDWLPEKIKRHQAQFDGAIRPFKTGAMGVWPYDESGIGAGAGTAFRLERKWKTPPTENKYFSVAPMTTTDHFSILEEIEKSLMSR